MSEPLKCDRCELPASYRRWIADPNSRGSNLNEPGMKPQLLCAVHANEVRMYVGGPMERLESAEVNGES